MSGVRTGSRLEQLEALRARIDHEIAVERRRLIVEEGRRWITPGRRNSPAPSQGDQLLQQHAITASQVRTWALDHGLIDKIARGRVPTTLVQQYVEAHQ